MMQSRLQTFVDSTYTRSGNVGADSSSSSYETYFAAMFDFCRKRLRKRRGSVSVSVLIQVSLPQAPAISLSHLYLTSRCCKGCTRDRECGGLLDSGDSPYLRA